MQGRPVPGWDFDTPSTVGRRASIAGCVSAAAVRHRGKCLNHPRCSSQTRAGERGPLWRGSWTSLLTMRGDTTGVVESVCGRGEPDSASCGARMRQPESPQEATGSVHLDAGQRLCANSQTPAAPTSASLRPDRKRHPAIERDPAPTDDAEPIAIHSRRPPAPARTNDTARAQPGKARHSGDHVCECGGQCTQ